MKAVILAAGRTHTATKLDGITLQCGFPPDSKPKCLFHVNGVMLLERIIGSLKEAGVWDVLVVVGYKHELIEGFKQRFGFETVYNSLWDTDPVNSLFVGLQDVDDDVLVLFSDILINADMIRAFLRNSSPLVWVKGLPNEGNVCLIKVARKKLDIFDSDSVYANMRRSLKRRNLIKATEQTGSGLIAAITETLFCNGPVDEIEFEERIKDIDWYKQTDESKGLNVEIL